MAGISLSKLTAGQVKQVSGFENERLGGKLMAMGMLPGANVELVRTVLAGTTYYIKFNGHCMAIRKKEAEGIILN